MLLYTVPHGSVGKQPISLPVTYTNNHAHSNTTHVYGRQTMDDALQSTDYFHAYLVPDVSLMTASRLPNTVPLHVFNRSEILSKHRDPASPRCHGFHELISSSYVTVAQKIQSMFTSALILN
jgi:hypothetical protein